LLGLGDLLAEVVERGYVGVVVVLVVQFHDLAGDGGFKRAVVIYGLLVCNVSIKVVSRTWEVGQSGLAANKRGAGETSSRSDGSCGSRGGAQSRCAEECGVHDGFN
jgi:hypothetical protein